jgi:hypothetical protein
MAVVFLALGVLVMVAGRIVRAMLRLGNAPTTERQNAGDRYQSSHPCGPLDHRCSFCPGSAWAATQTGPSFTLALPL